MIEQLILSNLALNEEYSRKILPFVKEEYFSDNSQRIVYKLIKEYIDQYNNTPTREALIIDLGAKDGLNTATFEGAQKLIASLDTESHEMPWLIDRTEKFCQDKAIYNAIMSSIKIMENKNENQSRGAIPQFTNHDLTSITENKNVYRFVLICSIRSLKMAYLVRH
jgi:replicative DNA helicase